MPPVPVAGWHAITEGGMSLLKGISQSKGTRREWRERRERRVRNEALFATLLSAALSGKFPGSESNVNSNLNDGVAR